MSVPPARATLRRPNFLRPEGEPVAIFDDDPLKPIKKPTHDIGQLLDDLSAGELRDRIGLLEAEIKRLEAAIKARGATQAAAAAFFKS